MKKYLTYILLFGFLLGAQFYAKDKFFTINAFGYNYTNTNVFEPSTNKHEFAHYLYANMSKEQKAIWMQKIKNQTFMKTQNFYDSAKTNLVDVEPIYKVQSLFNPGVIENEIFAYYIYLYL